MAEFRQALPLVVIETESPALEACLQQTILLAKKRDRVLVFTLSPPAQRRQDELKQKHSLKSTADVVDPCWDTTGSTVTVYEITSSVSPGPG
jgi:hypothetical protein